MALTALLLVVGGLIGFISWIWLVVVAFRVGVGWGVVMLLLAWTWVPIVIFAIQYWHVAKQPILLWILACVISASAYAVGLVALGSEVEALRPPAGVDVGTDNGSGSSAELLPPPRPTAEPTHPSWEAVVNELERPADGGWEEHVPPPTPVNGPEKILSWDQTKTRIGDVIVLELTNNTSVTAVVEAVEPDRIQVRHTIGGGEASYWIERDQVASIRRP